VYRAVDQHGQVIDVLVSARRDAAAARRFFRRAMTTLKVRPTEVVTDAAPVYPAVLDEVVPSAWHHVGWHANNRVEADHSQLKHRLRPMRGLRTDRTAQTIIAGHAFMQNLRHGHYELGVDAPRGLSVAAAFTELASVSLSPQWTVIVHVYEQARHHHCDVASIRPDPMLGA
jgi:IS6 family transposase